VRAESGLDYSWVNVGYKKDGYFKRETIRVEKVAEMKRKHSKDFYVTVWNYPGKEYKKHAEEGNFIGPFYADN